MKIREAYKTIEMNLKVTVRKRRQNKLGLCLNGIEKEIIIRYDNMKLLNTVVLVSRLVTMAGPQTL